MVVDSGGGVVVVVCGVGVCVCDGVGVGGDGGGSGGGGVRTQPILMSNDPPSDREATATPRGGRARDHLIIAGDVRTSH